MAGLDDKVAELKDKIEELKDKKADAAEELEHTKYEVSEARSHFLSLGGEDSEGDEILAQEVEELHDPHTWSWMTWLSAVVLVLGCGGGLCNCLIVCLCDVRGLISELGSLLNPRGYALLDLEGEQDIPRILRREMRPAQWDEATTQSTPSVLMIV
jgi:ribose/xylose/arabinose/galactoside ABC-type transport system permease subunit